MVKRRFHIKLDFVQRLVTLIAINNKSEDESSSNMMRRMKTMEILDWEEVDNHFEEISEFVNKNLVERNRVLNNPLIDTELPKLFKPSKKMRRSDTNEYIFRFKQAMWIKEKLLNMDWGNVVGGLQATDVIHTLTAWKLEPDLSVEDDQYDLLNNSGEEEE